MTTGTLLPNHLSADVLADRLKRGDISTLNLMNACLDRIAAREPDVKAWAFLDAEQARTACRSG
jgi:Asp-tRNA(Asn)/Glu-tRNA(Gln) amidotransferase A subunit family amidase